MKRPYYIMLRPLVIIALFAMTACEVDTYDMPSETLTGRLVDTDGEPFVTEPTYGFKIRKLEAGASQVYDFWGKEDGTFRKTKILWSTDKIYPSHGAFFQLDPVDRDIPCPDV